MSAHLVIKTMNTNRIIHAFAIPVLLCASALAQGEGTYELTDRTGGNNEIHLDTRGKLKVTKVERWNPWTEKWEEVKPKCITPNPGKHPVIDFGSDGPTTEKGEKFRFSWKTEDGEGSPFNHAPRFLKDRNDDC